MIDELLTKGLAYVAPDGSVYYKIAAFPSYGALSRIKERELQATVTAADDDHKDDASDFALWKAYKPEEDGDVKWPGPRGAAEGRPGWHIECSAMSRKHLGETIDLHAGGVDLLFPHHENEIAQSQGCTGHLFSHHWYHTEFLLVDGKKMSKSLGNLSTLDDLVSTHGSKPMAVRLALLSGHPRKQLNFTLDSLDGAESALKRIYNALDKAGQKSGLSPNTFSQLTPIAVRDLLDPNNKGMFAPCWWALCDDLNIPGALGELFVGVRAFEMDLIAKDRLRFEISSALTILFALGLNLTAEPIQISAPAGICKLAERRWAARLARDFQTADALRAELAAAGWAVLDGKDGYKLEPLKKA
jgi:cysteinyl-tRNA synthetase